MNLKKIKGIGKETIADINRVFPEEQDLINALIQDQVPLRNDVVRMLKEAYSTEMKGGIMAKEKKKEEKKVVEVKNDNKPHPCPKKEE